MKQWFGKRCVAKVGRRRFELLAFDWKALRNRRGFVTSIFSDCDVPGDFAGWVDVAKNGEVVWVHPKEVPVALIEPADEAFRSGLDYPQFHELWVTDPTTDGPVYTVEVDGSAVPRKRAPKLVAKRSQLTFEAAPPKPKAPKADTSVPQFDTELETLQGVHADGGPRYAQAQKLLARLITKKNEPASTDVRWVGAMRDALVKAILKHDDNGAGTLVYPLSLYSTAALVEAMNQLAKTASKSNRLYALSVLTNELNDREMPEAIVAAIALLKGGRRESYIESELIEYIGSGVRPVHLPALRALKKVRTIKNLDKVIAWATQRPKKFVWQFDPWSDDDE